MRCHHEIIAKRKQMEQALKNKKQEQILVEARELRGGECFKKRTGTYAYIKVSRSALKFMGLDPNEIWGTCFNGNVTKMEPHTKVARVSVRDVYKNMLEIDEWEEMVGCKDRSIQ